MPKVEYSKRRAARRQKEIFEHFKSTLPICKCCFEHYKGDIDDHIRLAKYVDCYHCTKRTEGQCPYIEMVDYIHPEGQL